MQKKLIIQSKADNIKNESGIRLNKYLSDSGICSRREADRLIADGKVYVNGKKAEMGMRVTSNDKVECNGKTASIEEDMVLLAFNKPAGVECTTDRSNPDNIIDYIKYPKKIFYVGRLDKNSTGLILMTNDGDLANKIAKAVNCHEKEYVVRVNKKITDDFLAKMANGVPILDTVTRKCSIKKTDDYSFNIILTQGLNRQIRRMCEVLDLHRIRVMNIRIGNLKTGNYRNINKTELDELLKNI